jgi:uncharacterized RDD family membrane protein YckC
MFQSADIDVLPDPVRHRAYYADIPAKRLIAWMIDTVLIAFVTAILIPFTGFLALFFLGGLYLVVGFVYRWASIARLSATPGMVVMGIGLRDARGQRFDGGLALLHTAAYTASVALIVPQVLSVALMALSARKQGLTDHVLGSVMLNRTAGWAL